jgi:hypothetical protein
MLLSPAEGCYKLRKGNWNRTSFDYALAMESYHSFYLSLFVAGQVALLVLTTRNAGLIEQIGVPVLTLEDLPLGLAPDLK